MSDHPRAWLVEAAPNGAPGEGDWWVLLDDGQPIRTIIQPSKDIPGESWISRAWHPGLAAHLGGGGTDALDAALAVIEDWRWRRASGGRPRVAMTGDSREKREHRARWIEAYYPAPIDEDGFG